MSGSFGATPSSGESAHGDLSSSQLDVHLQANSSSTTTGAQKRTRFACQRCRKRKRRCDGIPDVKPCSSCLKAKEHCSILFNRQDDQKYIKSLEEKIKYLEGIITSSKGNSKSASTPISKPPSTDININTNISASPPDCLQPVAETNLESDIVRGTSFLTFGNSSEFLGSIAGFNLSYLLKKTLRDQLSVSPLSPPSSSSSPSELDSEGSKRKRRRLSSTSASLGKISWAYLLENEEFCTTIINAFIKNQYSRFPIMPKEKLFELNDDRSRLLNLPAKDRADSIDRFMLLIIYATGLRIYYIGGLSRPIETLPYTPEDLYDEAMKSLEWVTSSIDISSVLCLELVALYMMRSTNPQPIWHLMSFIMRFCIELGMNRKEMKPIPKGKLNESVERRRLFWNAYLLERAICFHTCRPFSISDSDIDLEDPFNIDSSIVDNDQLYELIYEKPELIDPKKVVTDMSMGICLVRIRRFDSLVQHTIYRVDKEVDSEELVDKVEKLQKQLMAWQMELPDFEDLNSQLFVTLLYNRSMRILLVPLLSKEFKEHNKKAVDQYIEQCVKSCGTLCLISKKLIQLDGFCVSFLVVQTVFLSAMTLIYCILTDRLEWSIEVSTYLQACSTSLFVIAERMPVTKKHLRDPFEKFLNQTMDYIYKKQGQSNINNNSDGTLPDSGASSLGNNLRLGGSNTLETGTSWPYQSLLSTLDMPIHNSNSPLLSASSPQLSALRGSEHNLDGFNLGKSPDSNVNGATEEQQPQIDTTSLLHQQFQQQSDELWRIITDNTLAAWDTNGAGGPLEMMYGGPSNDPSNFGNKFN